MNTGIQPKNGVGFLDSITLFVALFFPVGIYALFWWFIPKTFLLVFLTVTLGGPLWFVAEMILLLHIVLGWEKFPTT